MYTVYPNAIDGYSNIRVVRDNIEEVIARDHNDSRSAIVAIEQTLGVRPQGAYGTVAALLADSYAGIQAHASGLPPRHTASQVDADLIGGHPHYNFSYPNNTVSTQLARLLAYVNAPQYAGSGARKFADGYQLPSGTYLESAVSEIVGRLGEKYGNDGANKIGYRGTGGSAFADGYALSPARLGASVTQIVSQLGGTDGDAKIGADAFTTQHGKFLFPAGSVSSQVANAGDLLDEASLILQQSLGGFVVNGLEVVRAGPSAADIGPGMACVKGRMLAYAGGSVVTGIGTHRIYAFLASDGTLQVGNTASPDVFAGGAGNQPTVMLQTFVETGAGWTDSFDLRRYGMFANNKPYLTVGGDGYGADFTSLRSAIAYAAAIGATTAGLNVGKKILLTSDLYVPSAELPTSLPPGIEIDGGGHILEWDTDTVLFDNAWGASPTDQITLRDIRAWYTNGSSGTSAAFASFAGAVGGSSSFRIIDCELTIGPSAVANNYFVIFDTTSGGVSDVLVSGCSAQAMVSAVCANVGAYITKARVVNNRFYQDSTTITANPCVGVGDFSIVEGNLISGGYDKGVATHNSESVVVSGNTIDGGTGVSGVPGTPMMSIGVHLETEAVGYSSRSLVAANIIKGVAAYGVSCRNGANTAANVHISDNIVDNRWDQGAAMTGIIGSGSDTLVTGNYILYPGQYGIEKASHAMGNYICGVAALPMTAGISVDSGVDALVADNILYDCVGIGIDCGGSGRQTVIGNILWGGVGAGAGISGFGPDSCVAGNTIRDYGNGTHVIGSSTACQNAIISGNSVLYPDVLTAFAIGLPAFDDGYGVSVIGNMLGSEHNVVGLPAFGVNINSNSGCVVIGNHIFCTGSGSGDGIWNVGDENIVTGNRLVNSNGDAISVVGDRAIISGNNIVSPQAGGYGVNLSGANNCAVTNNMIWTLDATAAGIHIGKSKYTLVSGNHTNGFSAGIWVRALDAISSEFSNIVGNTCRSVAGSGIYIDTDAYGANIVGNLIETCDTGISILSPEVKVSSNHISLYATVAIDLSGLDRCCVTGNMGRSPAGVDTDGIDAIDCDKTLICGNWMEAAGSGTGFVLPGTFGLGDRMVVSGNLATGGVAPSDGAAGAWGTNPVVDVDNRHIT